MTPAKPRIDWIDHAKGICIILVVMMHATLGVEKAAGAVSWLGGFIEWARPFRMPDFFLLSGLFLAARIARPWPAYLDTKVVHFAYFYVLWMTIQFILKGPGNYMEDGASAVVTAYLTGFIAPYGTLWFIYLLAVFFVATKLLAGAPRWLVFAAAALLEILPIHTGNLIIDEFAGRFVYFYAGYWLAGWVFAYAEDVARLKLPVLAAGLALWAAAHTALVAGGLAFAPVFSLAAGFIGTCAVIALAVLCARLPFTGWLRYCGENSIVIYLAFVLFMAATRTALLKTGVVTDLGLVALIVTAVSVTGALATHRLTRGTRFDFLFRRPSWAKAGGLPVDVIGGNRREVHNI